MLRNQILMALTLIVLVLAVYVGHETREAGRLLLKEVQITGLVHTQADEVLAVMDAKKGQSILAVDLEKVRDQIGQLPWVLSVQVRRHLPSALMIRIVEKEAVVMGREKDQLLLLDKHGKTIKPLGQGDPIIPPVIEAVTGVDAPAQVVYLAALLERHLWLKERVSEAVGLPGGRWTLYTKQGVRLLLSKRLENELELLKKLQDRYGILDRKIRQVELRIPGRVAVRLAL